MPTIQIIGDVHGHLNRMIEIIDLKVDFVLQVGDLGIILLEHITQHEGFLCGTMDD